MMSSSFSSTKRRRLASPTENLSITVNGTSMTLPVGSTITDLLRLLEVEPGLVAVEQNFEIVPREQYPDREILEGDRLEIVHFVGGG
jgi:thiamine biosynthesis protein ThiS